MFKKFSSGNPLSISASDWNAMIDAAIAHRNKQNSATGKESGYGRRPVVLVRNSSGTNIVRGQILGIEAPIILPTTNENEFLSGIALDCDAAVIADHSGKFVVAVEPITDGKIGSAVAFGMAHCLINVISETDEYIDAPATAGYIAESCASGSARIVWREGGTGEQWGIVQLMSGAGGSADIQFVQATADSANGQVSAKAIQFLGDLSAHPNFEQTGDTLTLSVFQS